MNCILLRKHNTPRTFPGRPATERERRRLSTFSSSLFLVQRNFVFFCVRWFRVPPRWKTFPIKNLQREPPHHLFASLSNGNRILLEKGAIQSSRRVGKQQQYKELTTHKKAAVWFCAFTANDNLLLGAFFIHHHHAIIRVGKCSRRRRRRRRRRWQEMMNGLAPETVVNKDSFFI